MNMNKCNCFCHAPSRGEVINRSCYLGSQIVMMLDLIPKLEKQSRKTPSKSLLAEVKKVEQAKENLPKMRAELKKMQVELQELKFKLLNWKE